MSRVRGAKYYVYTLIHRRPKRRLRPSARVQTPLAAAEEARAIPPAVRSRDRPTGDRSDSFVKAEPGHACEEPRDLRRRSRRRAHHGLPRRAIFSPAARIASGLEFQISLWLWFTVLFANFAEAMAEARGKAQADTLRKTKTDANARI